MSVILRNVWISCTSYHAGGGILLSSDALLAFVVSRTWQLTQQFIDNVKFCLYGLCECSSWQLTHYFVRSHTRQCLLTSLVLVVLLWTARTSLYHHSQILAWRVCLSAVPNTLFCSLAHKNPFLTSVGACSTVLPGVSKGLVRCVWWQLPRNFTDLSRNAQYIPCLIILFFLVVNFKHLRT